MANQRSKNYENFDNKPHKEETAFRELTAEELFKNGLCFLFGENVEQDYVKAFNCFNEALSLGYLAAEFYLGYCYYNGLGIEKNIEQGIYWYLRAAERGDKQAQHKLGVHYYNLGGDINYIKAVVWFTKAAAQYNEASLYALGVCYENGNGIEQDYNKAFILYEKAAINNYVDAYYKLGEFYLNGLGVEEIDYSTAVYWLKKSSDAGNVDATYQLAKCYSNGIGVPEDKNISFNYLLKGAIAGDQKCQYMLAIAYEYGDGTEVNNFEAFKWYKEAASTGFPVAIFSLAECYLEGIGTKKNTELAFKYYLESANLGYAVAQAKVGMLYDEGEIVPLDKKEAFKYFILAADQGNAIAQFYAGTYYIDSEVIPQDYQKAIYYLKKAVEQDDDDAKYNLALCYYYGYGVEKDYQKAFEFFKEIAEKGDPASQNNLGNCYELGYGVQVDYDLALYWYEKSAESGDACAQYNVGNMYHKVLCEERRSIDRALYWYKKAASNGIQQAIDALREIELAKSITFGCRKDVFISWNHHDIIYKDRINKYLSDSQIISCFESDGGCHGVVEEAVEDAINSSKMYLVILTGNSIKSIWVQKEIALILNKVKKSHLHAQLVKPVVINVINDDEGKEQYFDVIKAIMDGDNEVLKELISLGTIFNNEFEKTLEYILLFAMNGLSSYKLINYRQKLLDNLSTFQATLKNNLWNKSGERKGKTSASLSYSDEFVSRKITDNKKEYEIEHLLNQDSFLLSTAGCGKTILLNKLIYDNYSENCFMMRIPLKDVVELINDATSVLDIMAHLFDTIFAIDEQEHKFSISLLSKYLLDVKDKYIFFDGINELPIEQKKKLANLIAQYKIQYPNTKLIYASRDINDASMFEGVQIFELLPISLEETTKLYRSIAKKFIDENDENFIIKQEEFFNKLEQIDDDILGNPLLLSNLIIIYVVTGVMPLKYFDIVETALKVVFMETLESLAMSVIENKHNIGENELYDLLGYISHCRINGSGQSLVYLIEKFYKDKDNKNKTNPLYRPRYKAGMGKDIYEYLSKQGIIQGENITHDIYRDVLASRWYFYMIYTTLEYFGLEYLDFSQNGKENLAMLLSSSNSESEAWNNISLAFLTKLDDKVFELCSTTTLDTSNKSYPVFDETLSIIFSEDGFNKENINRIIELLNKEGFYYGEFIKQYIKE